MSAGVARQGMADEQFTCVHLVFLFLHSVHMPKVSEQDLLSRLDFYLLLPILMIVSCAAKENTRLLHDMICANEKSVGLSQRCIGSE